MTFEFSRMVRFNKVQIRGFVSAISLSSIFLIMFNSISPAEAHVLKVKHEHVKGGCTGELTIDDNGIRYQTLHTRDQRQWTFTDIQEVQFISEHKINIIAYEDSRQRLGGDKIFKFELLGEVIPVSVIQLVESKFEKPISNRFSAGNLPGKFELAVKHLHRVSGCQGKLIFTEDGISFRSEKAGESRTWRYSDLQSIASSGRFELRLGTFEHGPLQYGDSKEFRFRLKNPLDEAAYRFAWGQINQLPLWRAEVSGK
ncbi:MAG: hypothetical protein LAO31_21000 [Acidobacteriia bacterium]|nr:hypothetical protein [Terriglobia bacterium]